MENKHASKYIEESKIQARRDLNSARILLSLPDPHLENVAFLLTQSYEKILKAVYFNYKISLTTDSWENIYKKTQSHNIDFIFEMLRDIHRHYRSFIEQNIAKCLPAIKELDMIPDNLHEIFDSPEKQEEKIMDGIKQLEQKVDRLKDKNHFVNFISKLNSNSIKETDMEHTEITKYIDVLDDPRLVMLKSSDLPVPNKQTMIQYAIFLNMLKALAPYTLPHVVASRYPIKECKMENLAMYRNSSNLKSFFDKLAYKIQMLLDSENNFTEPFKKTYFKDLGQST